MSETPAHTLDEETVRLIQRVAEESRYFDEDEVQFEELLEKMANDYLIVLKLKSRAVASGEEGEQATIDDEELSADPEIKKKQREFQDRIFENI